MKEKLFSRDFTLVVVGQIISLFGNAAIRFALPLYLLNQTGSSALYGTVTACAFIPSILLSPVGGIIADRMNKRNIMVGLDLCTGAVITGFCLLINCMNLVVLITLTLMILYGIAGAYQPSVQASIPALVCHKNYISANSVINMVSSLASLLGPVLGGILYSAWGLKPVLFVCILCFLFSAIMEIFIHIPYVKQSSNGSITKMVKDDFSKSITFIRTENPIVGKLLLVICAVNLFMSAMMVVGMPYLITEVLEFETINANQLYGFAEGILSAGGLAGGILAGVLGSKLSIQKSGTLLIADALFVFPIGIALLLFSSGIVHYVVLAICGFFMMAISTIFTIQMLSFVQAQTPPHLIGKVIALILTLSMCAQPLGNAFYGIAFQACQGLEFSVVLFSGAATLLIAVTTKNIFRSL